MQQDTGCSFNQAFHGKAEVSRFKICR